MPSRSQRREGNVAKFLGGFAGGAVTRGITDRETKRDFITKMLMSKHYRPTMTEPGVPGVAGVAGVMQAPQAQAQPVERPASMQEMWRAVSGKPPQGLTLQHYSAGQERYSMMIERDKRKHALRMKAITAQELAKLQAIEAKRLAKLSTTEEQRTKYLVEAAERLAEMKVYGEFANIIDSEDIDGVIKKMFKRTSEIFPEIASETESEKPIGQYSNEELFRLYGQ